MGALPRPDLPAGPHRDLVDAIHDLHHRGGWPSLRRLAAETGVSHTTVSKVLSSSSLPAWGTLELLVEALDGDAHHFHELWLGASAPDHPLASRTRIAGRVAELAVVRRHLETGTGLLLVTGEAGIGKTTLVKAAASDTSTFVAVGHCLPLAADTPLVPVIDVLAALQGAASGSWFAEAVEELPPYVRQSLGRVLPQLRGPPTESEAEEFARQHLFTSIATVLERVAERHPIAAVVEDLHWADPATLDLLEHLTFRSTAIPVVGSWRSEDDATPDANDSWFARLHRRAEVGLLALGPLSRDETAQQLALLGASLPERLDSIHSRTLGQPLFTEQLASHGHDGTGLPDLLAELLDRRLRGLTDASWAVMCTLGLAERPLTTAQLAAATAIASDTLTAELRTLRDRRLLRPGADDLVHLQHPLLAEATRRRLVPGEGAAVHRALAEVLSVGADARSAEVAHHWQRTRDREREMEWRLKAARDSAKAFDWAREAECWLRVLDLWPPGVAQVGDSSVTRPAAYIAAMDALNVSMQWERAADMSAAAEKSLGDVDELTRAELLLRAAEYRGEREGVVVGMALINEAVDLFARHEPGEGYLLALGSQRGMLLEFGRYDEAIALARTAVRAAVSAGADRPHRQLLISLAWHEGVTGFPSKAFDLLAQGQALFADGTDPVGDIRSAVIASDVLLVCGHPLSEVRQATRPGFDAARSWGIDSEAVMILTSNLALALLRAGEVAEAGILLDVLDERPPDPDMWPLDSVRAVVDVRQGRLDAAAARARVAVEVGPPDEIDLEPLCMAADVDFWRQECHVSLPRLLRELGVVADSAPIRVVLPGLVTAARAAAEAPPLQKDAVVGVAGDLVARASANTGTLGDRDPHVMAHLRTARAELARAVRDDRILAWTVPAALWDRLGRPHDAAYCRWRAAQVALRAGQGSLAGRLLKRAATDAREHVPLSEAIQATFP